MVRQLRAKYETFMRAIRYSHAAGGELEPFQFLLGHVSIQTTERYLGRKQRIQAAVNHKIGTEPAEGATRSLSADHAFTNQNEQCG
jgi:hypothetical protein